MTVSHGKGLEDVSRSYDSQRLEDSQKVIQESSQEFSPIMRVLLKSCRPDLSTNGASCGKKTINTKESLADIKAGMHDSTGILNALKRLILVGLMAPFELAERRSWAKTI